MFITTVLFLNLNHWLLEKSEMLNLQMLTQKKYIQCFKFMLSFWKNMLSNVHLHFFGVDAILAHAKAWDLLLWKCPRHFYDPSICFNFLYFHRKVNTFKSPEMCLNLDSDIVPDVYNYFSGIVSLF